MCSEKYNFLSNFADYTHSIYVFLCVDTIFPNVCSQFQLYRVICLFVRGMNV